MPRPSKGDRKPVAVRVPREVHEQLMEIKRLTNVDVTDQLSGLVTDYASRALREARSTHKSTLFEEAHAKSA